MEKVINRFTKSFFNIQDSVDVFQAVADAFQLTDKAAYSVCLRVDQETFEFNPVRDVDRILLNNVNKCIENGLCGQLLEPNKVVFITDHERFNINTEEAVLLLPVFYNKVQHGLILTFFPIGLLEKFEEQRCDFDSMSEIASRTYDLMINLEQECEENEKHIEVEGRLNNIVQNVVHGLISLDISNTVQIFNKNAEIIFGIAAPAVIGKSYRETFPEKLVRTFDILVESTLIEGSILDYQVDIEIAPGVMIPVGISSSVLLDNTGIHQGIICVCRDMSLTKEVNRLKELDQMKSEFVSMVSHELKNPIAIIKSSIETFLAARRMGKSLGEDYEQNTLESINDEVNRLSQLINDILNLSRIEAGRVEVKKEPNNVQRFLESAVHMFKIHEETHPIKIEVENIDQPILFDPDKIKQVVINYVGNAVKYSPQGCNILVKAVKEGNDFKLMVSDSGIGIPEDRKDDVFQKFSRISTPETATISGTGLGLSICKKIVELHRGHVWFESVYQKGSTFGFTLPLSNINTSSME